MPDGRFIYIYMCIYREIIVFIFINLFMGGKGKKRPTLEI